MAGTDERVGWVPVEGRDYAPTYDQIATQQRNIEAKQSTGDMLSAVLDDTQLLMGGKRVFDRNFTDFKPEEGFTISKDQHDSIRHEFGDEQAKEITSGVMSPGELNSRMGYYREDINRKRTISSYGMVGVGAALVSSVLDPVGWAAAYATGGIGGGAKLTQIARVTRMAASAGITNAAMEAALYAGDTQKSVDDVFVSGLAGMVMGGTIGSFTRARARPEPTLREQVEPTWDGAAPARQGDPEIHRVVEGADDFDNASRAALGDAAEYDAWLAARANTTPAEFDARIGVADHIDNLKKAADIRPTRADKVGVKSDIAANEARLDFLKTAQRDARASEAAARGAPRNSDEALNLTVATRAASNAYTDDINNVTRTIEQLKAKKAKYDGVDNARSELKRFSSQPPEQQAKELGITQRKMQDFDVTSHVQRAVSEMRAERAARYIHSLTPEPEVKSNALDNATATKPEPINKFAPVDDSIGAARVKDSAVENEMFSLSANMDNLMDDLIREARASDVRPIRIPGGSVSSQILTSENPAIRGLGLRILENSQGGGTAGKTASILSDVNNNLIRTAEGNRFNDGWDRFLKEQGLSPLEYLKTSTVARFNEDVYSAIARSGLDGVPADVSPSVKLAAEGIAAKFEKGLSLRKQAGEAGFEDITSASDYMPTLFDGPKIAQAVTQYGSDNVEALISKGYQTGKYKIAPAAADAVAKMQTMRALDSTLSSRLSFERVVSQAERESFVDGLRKAGVPDHVIDNIIEGQELDDLASSISNRAKASLGINSQAEVDGVSVQSMLKTNVSEIAENYGKEAAAGAAMARMGFPTRNSVMAAVDAAERISRNMGQPIKKAQSEANQLRDSIKLIYGNTLDDDPNSGIVKATRRMREITTITRLNQMGFAQLPEIARATVKMGLGTVLKSVPATSFLRSRSARVGGKAHAPLKEPELREVEEAIGYVGEDNWLVGWATRHDEFGESPDNLRKISKVLDNSLAAGSRANVVLSGFKAIQGGSEKIVARSIASRLKDHLSGGKKLPTKDLNEIGLNEEIMGRLKKHFDDNPRYDEFNGQQVRMLNFDAMEPDLKEAVGVGIRRMQGRLIQRHFVGDEGIWMNKWWGKAIAQFKGFSIVSIEKQLIHDIRGDKVAAAQIFAWSAFLAYASYATQMQLQGLGRADRKEFLEEKFNDQNMAMGVFNKMPQVAGLGLAGDGLGTLGLLPDSMMRAPGRTGFNQMGAGDLVPAIGMVGDYTDLSRTFAEYASGSDDVSTRQMVDKVRRVIPLMNAIGIGQASKASVDLLEDQ